MTVTQRGQLAPEDLDRLLAAKAADTAARDEYKRVVVELMGASSMRTVRAATGLSLDTLQRWKNEAT